MKKFIEIVMFFCFFSTIGQAKEIEKQMVGRIAINAYGNLYNKEKSLVSVKEILPIKSEDLSTTLYVVNINPTGFLVISASDATIPVLASSDKSNFSLDQIPPQLKFLFDYYGRQIRKVEKQNIKASPDIKNEWDKYLNQENTLATSPVLKSASTITFPLVSTTWNQNAGWNQYCPADASAPSGNGGHVPAGCGPIAMAQILYYWGCRVNESGSRTISSSYGNLYADFTAADYLWSSMSTDSPNEYNARLIYDCGIAANTNYASSGSTTGTQNTMDAFRIYFGFKNTLTNEVSSSYTDPQWINLLKGELDSGRPILFSGSDDIGPYTSVHAWVIDGYNTSNQFHCNWGGGGSYNGYYSLNNLNPGLYLYTPSFSAIINLEPVMSDCSEINGGPVICSSGTSFNVPNLPSGATVTWDKSSNITFDNQSGNPKTFVANGSGLGWIEATVHYNGDATLDRKDVWVGGPVIYSISGNNHVDTYGMANYEAITPADMGATYTWSVEPSGTVYSAGKTASVYFQGDGDYRVYVTATNSCGVSESAVRYVGVGSYWPEVIYPNPADDKITLQMGEPVTTLSNPSVTGKTKKTATYEIQIWNEQGIRVKTIQTDQKQPVISTRDLPNGRYILHVVQDGKTTKQQFLIRH